MRTNPRRYRIEVELKAGWEVKGEIPEQSLTRLVDSQTDVIRPFTETHGLTGESRRGLDTGRLGYRACEVQELHQSGVGFAGGRGCEAKAWLFIASAQLLMRRVARGQYNLPIRSRTLKEPDLS